MSEEEQPATMASKNREKAGGQVSLAQMLKVLDKDVATEVEKRLKKLSKKKGLKGVVNEREVVQSNRKVAYDEAVQEVSKWEPIVELNQQIQMSFPLDVQPDNLPTTAESLTNIKPRNELEREVQLIIDENKAELAKEKAQKKIEERYKKAISADEAKERHLELQRTRVKLNDFAAKMRRQKKIKSKSYHRLLKRERIKKHMKNVESNQDALMNEIERLQKIRAQERATLKHKNTGKWAKHAKFRAKYDEEARRQMLEQIGIANQLLERPAVMESDSEDEDSDEDSVADESESCSDDGNEVDDKKGKNTVDANNRPILSHDSIDDGQLARRRLSVSDDTAAHEDGDNNHVDQDDKDADEQRKLMKEAFADDDVVAEFKKAKDQIADEEQPKDIDRYLPGWGDWAGPGIEVNERKRQRFIKRAKKVERKDKTLGNVIISESANESIKELRLKQLPRGIRNEDHLKKVLTKPTTATFTDQATFRKTIQPKIVTRMGARIEPINKRVLNGLGSKAKWA